ncbi:MAG: hypothetical protein K8F35_10170 [Dokdonella sp.]|uniref:hypothetical protein n=1 Tax=Dokdonella sp. TaxID=2291710 RepID=UPI0025BDB3AB|nr:hypothetical protein [Dokdonella sp.]MBZ0223377.1 hypothetical protein [Dokdonella sp.]
MRRRKVAVVLRCLVVVWVLALAGCTLPPIRISDAPLPAVFPANPQLVDRRPVAEHVMRDRDHKRDPVRSYYLGDKDTVPARMDLLRARLAAVDYLQAPGTTVNVESFDILFDQSGDARGLSLDLSQQGIGMLDTPRVGNGMYGYRCTLIASIQGQMNEPIRVIGRGAYFRAEDKIGLVLPEQVVAAHECVDSAINKWIDEARPAPPPVQAAPEPVPTAAPTPKKRSKPVRKKSATK